MKMKYPWLFLAAIFCAPLVSAQAPRFDFTHAPGWQWHFQPKKMGLHGTEGGILFRQAYSQDLELLLAVVYEKKTFRQRTELRPVGYDLEGQRHEFTLESQVSANNLVMDAFILKEGAAAWEELVFIGLEKRPMPARNK
jgi:hypothetical protein